MNIKSTFLTPAVVIAGAVSQTKNPAAPDPGQTAAKSGTEMLAELAQARIQGGFVAINGRRYLPVPVDPGA